MVATVHSDRIFHAYKGSEMSFEVAELLPVNEISLAEAAADGLVDLGFQVLVVSSRIDERHFVGHASSPNRVIAAQKLRGALNPAAVRWGGSGHRQRRPGCRPR